MHTPADDLINGRILVYGMIDVMEREEEGGAGFWAVDEKYPFHQDVH